MGLTLLTFDPPAPSAPGILGLRPLVPSPFTAPALLSICVLCSEMTRPTGNKIGRPTKFGEVQVVHWDARQCGYNAMRNKDASQRAMTTFYNDELFLFFTLFGWDNPMSNTPSDEEMKRRRKEAEEAKQTEEIRLASKDRDDLVKHVHAVSFHSPLYASFASDVSLIRRAVDDAAIPVEVRWPEEEDGCR